MQGFVREIALEVVRADDAPMPVLVNASRRADPDGTADIVRITVVDATERRRYERELMLARRKAEEAAQSRARLVSTISHDLRAPLSAILTAGVLLEKSSPTERQMRFIRVIRTSSNQALALVNTVLELGRLEAGHATLRERDFDLGQLVRDVAEGSRLMAERKPDLALHVNIDDRLPATLVGDPDKITQILVNLTSNAVKFTEHGTVSLVVSVRDLEPATATVQVLVNDTGIGIPADRLSHIFEEYTQASRDIGEQFGGTGLGLAIARRLLLLYGSELRVTSTVGEGTTFSFELVLKRAGTTSLGETGG